MSNRPCLLVGTSLWLVGISSPLGGASNAMLINRIRTNLEHELTLKGWLTSSVAAKRLQNKRLLQLKRCIALELAKKRHTPQSYNHSPSGALPRICPLSFLTTSLAKTENSPTFIFPRETRYRPNSVGLRTSGKS